MRGSVPALLWWAAVAAGAPAAPPPAVQLTVELVDGSRLVGVPLAAALAFQTEYAALEIPWRQVAGLAPTGPAPAATVALQNGDRLAGRLRADALVLKTSLGALTVPFTQVAKLRVAEDPATRMKFDPAADFSPTDNPVGPWRYGWEPRSGGAFQIFTNKQAHQTQPALRVWGWSGMPSVGRNTGQQVIHADASATFAPGQIAFHPGADGARAVLRWTAPRAERVAIAGRFTGLSGYQGVPRSTTDVHVLHQAEEVFASLLNLEGRGNEAPFEIKVAVQPGDAVDFAVGYGNGNFGFDSTGLEAVLEYLP